ncbi:MAG: hypothetical protein JWM56_1114 [Candidatus Peribacteria bacterium]|nr:hypothetical protein [Candidatus Peribacteria bacterium]
MNVSMPQSRAHRTLSIGGATFDLFAQTKFPMKNLEIGSKIPVKDVIEACGGGAANSSVGLSRLGCQAGFAGIIGSDQWGEKLLKNFQTEHVDTSSATIVDGEITSFSIIISVSGGDRIILYTSGANKHLHDSTFDREHAAGMDWIYLNRLHEDSCEIQDDLILMLCNLNGPGLTWNPGGCQIEQGADHLANRGLLAQTDILLMNKEEALAFGHVASTDEAHRLFHSMGVGISCITDSKNGATAFDGKNIYHCPVLAQNAIVDTTGAGDAFGVGMTWALLNKMDLPNCLRAGTINATSVISSVGAETGLLTDILMRKQLEATRLDVTTRSVLS